MASPGPGRPTLPARLRAQLPLKIAVLLGLSIGICVPYFALQRLVLFPLRQPWTTALDVRIAFEPAWVHAYVSLALLVPLAPLLATTRAALRRYALGLALLCAVCFALFLCFPVAGPRPSALPGDGLYAWIVGIDRPANALPSLHAGLTAYSLLFAWRVLRAGQSVAARRLGLLLGAAWGGLILFSTLATKQHWLVDLPAGMGLAWAAHAFAWRGAVGTAASLRSGPG